MTRKLISFYLGLAALGLSLWFFGRPAYHRYKERRALALAHKFVESGDWTNASLSARQVLALDPANLQACEIMAGLADLAHAPQLLDWRRRLVELSPTLENKLALARAALRVQRPPYPLAAQTLTEAAPGSSNSVAFHLLAAELALKLNQNPQAEFHFQSAAELEPTNRLHQLNLAVVRLLSTNQAMASEARHILQGLAANTNLFAVRSLIVDALNHTNLAAAKGLSAQLLTWPGSTLEDKLQHLTILHAARSPEFPEFLAAVQDLTATNPAAVYAVSSWLTSHRLADDASHWLNNCSENVRCQMPVPLAIADTLVAARDWPHLETFLQTNKWGELECLRLAWLSQAAAAQNNSTAAAAQWRLAVHQAGNRFGPLLMLLSLAETWGRDQARQDLLWQLVDAFPRERWAARELGRLYLQTGNTLGLYKVSAWLLAHDAKDYIARNDLAATSMLLKADLPRAHQLAKENYGQHADEPIVAATFAYSLHLQGRTDEGLAVLAKLQPAAQEQPGIELYHGLLLTGLGRIAEARPKLEAAGHSPLLPEERNLLSAALAHTD